MTKYRPTYGIFKQTNHGLSLFVYKTGSNSADTAERCIPHTHTHTHTHTHSVTTVSYTHLDVYKRQIQHRKLSVYINSPFD